MKFSEIFLSSIDKEAVTTFTVALMLIVAYTVAKLLGV